MSRWPGGAGCGCASITAVMLEVLQDRAQPGRDDTMKSWGDLRHRVGPMRHRPRRDVGCGQGEEEQRLVPSSIFLTPIFAQRKCE